MYTQMIAEKREYNRGQKTTPSPEESPRPQYDDVVWDCVYCNGKVEPIELEIVPGNIRYIRRHHCGCYDGQRLKAEAEDAATRKEWRSMAESIIRPINVGVYATYKFGNWDRNRQPDAGSWADAVEQYADEVEDKESNWLYLYGNYGVGKTHLAIAALRKAAAVRLWKPHIVVWPGLCALTKESWSDKSGETEGSLWAAARNAKILLIDDIDKTASSEWALGKLYTLIDYRVTRQKPTIITANHSLEQLQRMWRIDTWQAVLSRIVGQLKMTVKMSGSDQRGHI